MKTKSIKIAERIRDLDEKINSDPKFDVRFGVELIKLVSELWKIKILNKINNEKNTITDC